MALKDDADTCTKMTLARLLQRRDLLADEESLEDAWKPPKARLVARVAGLYPAGARAKARAKARGKARGR